MNTSVLTSKNRISLPNEIVAAARKLMKKNLQKIRCENLNSADYQTALGEVVGNGQTGDKICDALHLRAAGKARAAKIHISNKRDFTPFAPTMEIVKLS